jgi:hypothetical protein
MFNRVVTGCLIFSESGNRRRMNSNYLIVRHQNRKFFTKFLNGVPPHFSLAKRPPSTSGIHSRAASMMALVGVGGAN